MTTAHTATHSSKAAIAIQSARDAQDIANHQERVIWLSGESPCWSDGSLVDAHSRHVLLLQSRAALAATGAA